MDGGGAGIARGGGADGGGADGGGSEEFDTQRPPTIERPGGQNTVGGGAPSSPIASALFAAPADRCDAAAGAELEQAGVCVCIGPCDYRINLLHKE